MTPIPRPCGISPTQGNRALIGAAGRVNTGSTIP
jgi:hypothetical protein